MSSNATPDITILKWLLKNASTAQVEAFSCLADWKAVFDREKSRWVLPADRAAIGGFLADRMAYAFAAGYQAALHKLDPTLPLEDLAALCVTEAGGGHPKVIESTLIQEHDHWTLN
jgi:hypothetical protein